ncbi:MAG TPA: multicopper oxidase domain-containing protein [Arachnia sp.]|nr:multicopper oxidase domain-containing protein [Arachnia sp.]HMT87041.1 multicopper oxidase domain-containing protein [Arachnia sp.]
MTLPAPGRGELPGLTRRHLLLASGIAGVAPAFAFAGCTPGQTTFPVSGTAPLLVPPLAPSRTADGTRLFTLTAQTGESRLIAGRPDVRTPTLGYDGAFLGPTLRAQRGERIRVDIRNDLAETTTLHWHGMHLPAAQDGGPHSPIAPGETRTVEWDLAQPAATLWYHPHPHGETEEQVLRGLAGLFIIDDDASLASGLPQEYGVDDIPLVLQDRWLDAGGRIQRADGDNALGTIGGTLLANGVSGTHFEVTTELVRLRLLNGSSARFLELRFDDGRPFLLVGTDGGLLGEPVERDRLLLSPGERAEVLVLFAPGDRATLRTEQPEIPGVRSQGILADMIAGDFVEFRAEPQLRPAGEWRLPADSREPLHERDAAQTRGFVMKMPFLNGRRMDVGRIDAIVRLGDVEVWEVSTTDAFPHNFHIHDVQFRILDIDGDPPPRWLDGWKDTVPVFPGQTTRLIMRFEDYADDRIPYMMHCHLLQHEDEGMMGQFLVTEEGAGPDRIDPPATHDGH